MDSLEIGKISLIIIHISVRGSVLLPSEIPGGFYSRTRVDNVGHVDSRPFPHGLIFYCHLRFGGFISRRSASGIRHCVEASFDR